MFKNIIFDLGGVLMTDVPLMKIARDLSVRFSMSGDELHSHLYPTEHWTLLTLGEISEDEYWDHFLKASKINVDKEELKDMVRTELRPIEENVEIIPLLKSQYKLAILSNHSREWSEFMRKEFDFFNYFDQIIVSCNVGLRKPDPRIYQLALTRLHSEPEECLFIDDKKRNTDGAQRVGMKTIVLDDVSRLREKLFGLGVAFGGTNHVKKHKP
jgi:putative hydrolase of the HAD superfamily